MLSSFFSTLLYLITFPSTQPLPQSNDQPRSIFKHPYPPPPPPPPPPSYGQETLVSFVEQGRKVRVDLGVMSRCPDARLCEAVMDDVLRYPGIREKVNITLNYIGTLDENVKPYGVICKHGPLECSGNIHQLCIQKHLPNLSYAFTTTQNYIDPSRIGQIGYAKECLDVVGGVWEGEVEDCVDGKGGKGGKGGEGERLLRGSVKKMKNWGITKSCTILIEEKIRCIHDGEWYDCDEGHQVHDFVRTIEREWKRLQ